MTKIDYQQVNGIALAYLGDAAYEVYIREHLIDRGMTKPTKLHHLATHFVSAKAQSALIRLMEEDQILTDEEWDFFSSVDEMPIVIHTLRTHQC